MNEVEYCSCGHLKGTNTLYCKQCLEEWLRIMKEANLLSSQNEGETK